MDKDVDDLTKMIVMDLDGTLLNAQHKVSMETKSYLKRLKDQGFIIVIATGRIFASALEVTDGAEFAHYLLSSTGTFAYDLVKKEVLFQKSISREIIQKILDTYGDTCSTISICNQNIIYKYCSKIDSMEISQDDLVKVTDDKDFIIDSAYDVSQISICVDSKEQLNLLYKQLTYEFRELDNFIMQDSYASKQWIEIVPKGWTKYHAIQLLSETLHISNEDIIAFGDSLNDIEMLRCCGRGVAMKNALPMVKDVADEITRYDYQEDGVMHYLQDCLSIL